MPIQSTKSLTLDELILPAVQQDLIIREPSARMWLSSLPGIIEHVCKENELTVEEALHGGRSGCVLKVRTPSVYGPGHPLVLKVALNPARASQEAAALKLFTPGGATPKLHSLDPGRGTLLMDWVPATASMRSIRELTNGALPDRRELARLGELLIKLRTSNQVVGNDLELLAVPTLEEFHRSRLNAAGALRDAAKGTRPPTPANLNRAKATLDFLAATSADHDRTVIHGDLNSGNVLGGGDEPRIAVDPRPLRGDPAYDTAVLSLKRGEREAEKTARLLAAATGDDLERVLCWLFIARVSRV